MLEITLETMAVDVEAPTAEQVDAGAPPYLVVHVIGGSSLPLQDPQNPGRPVRFPSSSVHFPLSKQAALDMAATLIERAESLPDEPSGRIITANSMNEVEQVAKIQNGLTAVLALVGGKFTP